MEINARLLKSIEDYCKFNGITDIEKEVNNLLQIGFNVTRFGTSPFSSSIPIVEEVLPPKEEKEEVIIEKPKRVYKRKPKVEQIETVFHETVDVPQEEPIKEVEEKPKKRVRVIKTKKKVEDE